MEQVSALPRCSAEAAAEQLRRFAGHARGQANMERRLAEKGGRLANCYLDVAALQDTSATMFEEVADRMEPRRKSVKIEPN
jgi:hypothetical protein